MYPEQPVRIEYLSNTQVDLERDSLTGYKQFFLVHFLEAEKHQKKMRPVICLNGIDHEMTYFLAQLHRHNGSYDYLPNTKAGKPRCGVPLWLMPQLIQARAEEKVRVDAAIKARDTAPAEPIEISFLRMIPSGHISDPSRSFFFNVLYPERAQDDPMRKRVVFNHDYDGYNNNLGDGAVFLKSFNRHYPMKSDHYYILRDGGIAAEMAQVPPWMKPRLQAAYEDSYRHAIKKDLKCRTAPKGFKALSSLKLE